MKKRALLAAIVGIIVLIILVGCGGGGGDSHLYRQGSGSITSADRRNVDGSYSDIVYFRATRDGWTELAMNSDGSLDPYLLVYRGHGIVLANLIDSDDDAGPENGAFLRFWAYSGAEYTLQLTTFGAGDFGQYDYSIEEVDASTYQNPQSEPADVDKLPVDNSSKL